MRCENCGWPNKPSETRCTKCNSPLPTSDERFPTYARGEAEIPERPLNKTVRDDIVFSESNSEGLRTNDTETTASTGLSQCPKCGYPLRAGIDKCPNCKFQVRYLQQEQNSGWGGNAGMAKQNENSSHRPTRMASDGQAQSPGYKGTINPYMMNVETEPTFILKPIKRIDERHDFNEQEYEGREVVLNRDNTEPGNPSITSRQQAVITNENGQWFIEDHSEQKTTFVQAGKKIELHDGDIILLGNRLFEFHK